MKPITIVMRRVAILFALVAGTTLLVACNTVEGVGEDISSAARGVKDAITSD